MNKHKLNYEVPEASTFVVRFEGNIMSFNDDNTEKPIDGGEEDF